ncbi:MAG: segregation/condensation protein A [Deltaproteobacteria bacterium]|nr:segregation/condensation protein A [Deltaproteobacteria bacterium]
MSYNIKLDIFEGPLDLLLHLIKRNEIDIYDIPISVVTERYIQYLEMMKEMNLDFAGEFLVMAATLIHIKSKMLLPPDEESKGGEEEGPDPREELILRLIEYKKYKEAAGELGERLMLGRDVFLRGAPVEVQEGPDAGLVNLSVFDLMDAIKGVLLRIRKEEAIELTAERYRIADKINYVLEVLNQKGSEVFTALFSGAATKGEVIVTFLAVLELAKLLLIRVHQTEDRIIRVYSRASAEEETPEGPAQNS